MALTCIHTHTNFCDGIDDIETCCRVAYSKGLSALGFSAHAPVTKKTGFRTEWHLPDEKFPEYVGEVLAAKKRWAQKLPVYLGLEVDYIRGMMSPNDYREMDLDFIIGAVHYVFPPRGEPFTVDHTPEMLDLGIKEGFGGDVSAMIEDYFNSQEEMIRSGGFDLLAHADLVKKNNSGFRLFSEDDDNYQKRIAAIAALLTVPAEINTGGLNRGKIKDCYPSLAFLKQLRKHGAGMVINADAHRAQDIGGHYEEAVKALAAAGYTESLIFCGRKNGCAVWKAEPLYDKLR